MYDIEEITENMDDGQRWFSVISNMESYRVGGNLGSEVVDIDGNSVTDEELRETLINKVAEVVAKE